jgi:TPR repeat protein
MRGTIIIVAVGCAFLSIFGSPGMAQSRGSQEAPVTDCDAFAADPFDSDRKASGIPFEKINPKLALPACKGAIQQYPNSKRLAYQLGRAFDKIADYGSALFRYRQAAEQGYAPAQTAVGFAYANGNGVLRDETEAVIWYRKAAEQGEVAAETNLAIAYQTGHGLAQDYLQAIAWYRKAAAQGLAGAQVNLGNIYCDGLGIEKDEVQAAVLFRNAAEQGDMNGQHNLGVSYQLGRGVPKNTTQAIFWYRKAAEQGEEKSKKLLADLVSIIESRSSNCIAPQNSGDRDFCGDPVNRNTTQKPKIAVSPGAQPSIELQQSIAVPRTTKSVADEAADQLRSCVGINSGSAVSGLEFAKEKCPRELAGFMQGCQNFLSSMNQQPDVCAMSAAIVVQSAIDTRTNRSDKSAELGSELINFSTLTIRS